ncbi:MAG TPA: methylenetetrahydrofolate reductase [NAD(P)H] [Verrucomicrobiae bacterium]|nr:methylenetetrahydrofolate reductase [NAD(P)H] [Verrucomicrobiae bacterium]
MKISDILQTTRPTVSFEFFPPKTDEAMAGLLETLSRLHELRPAFTTCTYGAGGSTRARTLEVTLKIKEQFHLEAMAHFTCVGQTKKEIDGILQSFAARGIENVLALRGDRPANLTEPPEGWFPDFKHAIDLIRHLRKQFDDQFCIGCAGYPEKHPEAPDLETDLRHLKAKVDAGADFIITQLFFDNADFARFVHRCRDIGITVPIVAGIMPVANVAQIKKITAMCGAVIPHQMLAELNPIANDPDAVAQFGVDWSTRQCRELLASGVDGLHFYTLNKSRATRQIVENLRRDGILR